jgi:hypothetical protein
MLAADRHCRIEGFLQWTPNASLPPDRPFKHPLLLMEIPAKIAQQMGRVFVRCKSLESSLLFSQLIDCPVFPAASCSGTTVSYKSFS